MKALRLLAAALAGAVAAPLVAYVVTEVSKYIKGKV